MEIERKFLCGNVDTTECEKYEIEQYYICYNPEIRFRKRTGTKEEYFLTVKSKGFLARDEHEISIDCDIYGAFKNLNIGMIISKTRYVKRLSNNLNAEIDIYNGNYAGLKIVEVEFKDEMEAQKFIAPEWFLKDVTNLSKYKNSSLSKISKSN